MILPSLTTLPDSDLDAFPAEPDHDLTECPRCGELVSVRWLIRHGGDAEALADDPGEWCPACPILEAEADHQRRQREDEAAGSAWGDPDGREAFAAGIRGGLR